MARTPGTVMLKEVDVATPDAPRPAASATWGMRAGSNAVSSRSASTTISRTLRVSGAACVSSGVRAFGLRCEKNTVIRTAQIPTVTARKSSASAAAPERLRPALAPSATACFATRAHAPAGADGASRIAGVLDLDTGLRARDAGQQVLVLGGRAPALAPESAVTHLNALRRGPGGGRRRERAAAGDAASHSEVVARRRAQIARGRPSPSPLVQPERPAPTASKPQPKSRPANTWRKSFTSPSNK